MKQLNFIWEKPDWLAEKYLIVIWSSRQAWTITNLQQLKSIYATLEIQSNDKHVHTSEAKLGDIHIFTSQTGLAKLGAQLLLAIHGKNLLLQTT